MSVPEGKRSKSPMEYLHLAYKLNRDVTLLLIRDFGVKSISRDLKTFTHAAKMKEEDRKAFEEICKQYHIDVEASYPLWLIEHYRNVILNLLQNLCENITTANTIYPCEPDYEYWHNLRRKYQKLAQSNCYQLLQALQNITYILPMNKEKIMPYVELIDAEMKALKNWQRRTNQQRKKSTQK
ncbi:hypothetical protein [Anaerovibrio sp. RM50]|uniref:hypothetical protein n=1 Tax=Anaerovibrio sp. RM50 TaxID=1200557 RepID=UPI0012EB3CA3|nr:hypothetical protein [Anaerovibrio sp. RM50]